MSFVHLLPKRRRFIMKITAFILFCLSMVTGFSSNGQDTNTPDGWNQTDGPRHIDLKLQMPGNLGPVIMSEELQLDEVSLTVGGGSSFKPYPAPDVSGLGLQVWLLKKDGTSVPQLNKPYLIGIGNAGWDTDYMIYAFKKIPSSELAGIVVQVKGTLYSEAITSSMIRMAETPFNDLCGRWQSEQGDSYEFSTDGTYQHWKQLPPITKTAQAEEVDGSSRKNVSKGNFLVNSTSLVLIQKDGTSRTNKFYLIADGVPNDKGKFFKSGLSLMITLPSGKEKKWELMYR
jgi:hypothetical protein